jgi:periplasmic divalent cation tolerance protein
MGPYIVCVVTIDEIDKAASMARTILEQRLAACVNIVPQIRSIYTWKGEIHDEHEVLMLIKTRNELFDDLKEAVKNLHPYEVPEIIALNIEKGLPDYLNWIHETTKASI